MTRFRVVVTRTVAVLALAAALTGCSGGGASPAASASTGAGASAPASPAPTDGATVTASPAASAPANSSTVPVASPLPATPPPAALRGLTAGGDATGSLGTYTWAGGGSDAPWIVGKRLGTVAAGAKLEIAFGGLAPASWTAAWAKVANGTASGPVGGTSGMGAPTVTAPGSGGDWSLRVTGDFGPGSNATYYWRVTITP